MTQKRRKTTRCVSICILGDSGRGGSGAFGAASIERRGGREGGDAGNDDMR